MTALGRFLRQPLALAAATVVVLIVAACLLADLIAPYDPLKQDLMAANQLPSAAHWLGADSLGRDILSRLLYGGRVTLSGSVLAVSVFTVLGLPLGLIAGYRRGAVDRVLGRVVEVIFATPVIIILLVVLSVFSANLTAAMITLGVLGFGSLFRVVRASTLAAAGELYVKAARAAGLSGPAVLRRHILPNLWGQVIVQVALFAASAILTESGLAFLGFSVKPPNPSWGSMIGEASNVLSSHPFQLLPPGFVIGLVVLALGLVGDGVRDVATSRGGSGPAPSVAQTAAPALQSTTASAQSGIGGQPLDLPDDPTAWADDAAEEVEVWLTVRDLTVEFGPAGRGVTVLKGASFEVRAGEVLGIVGESGSGKTVTARALIDLLPPGGRIMDGSIDYRGDQVRDMSPAQLNRLRGGQIGYVPQEPMTTLDPVFTIGSQLDEVVRRHDRGSRAARRARALELLELVQLRDPASVLSRYPHELSGGMAQRVGLALALAGRPQLLIADEPTTALDVTVQQQVLDLLDELRARLGMAVLLVTHDWGVLADLADRALVMYAGQIVEVGPTTAVYAAAAHPYTRALIAANPATAQAGRPLPSIPGQVVPPGSWPVGCHFADRCAEAMPACLAGPVALGRIGSGRASRCLRSERTPALVGLEAEPVEGPAGPSRNGTGPARAAAEGSK
ncbi:MAG: dipeptide/oligopeptide/nickel ABC transporter permease/ATP-binding protein [Propionibacteriaceae bacterium]|jgi:peptide/nickel transport system permease protein|nr:dipeptide/oligopeptide/nickel ABC transporter permease/ATP-binding protein [Propionibacteriaceae bacterium]